MCGWISITSVWQYEQWTTFINFKNNRHYWVKERSWFDCSLFSYDWEGILSVFQKLRHRYCDASHVSLVVTERHVLIFSSVEFNHSVVSDFYNPMNCSTPGLPVHHQLPESTQTHVHWVGDAIQPSHPLSSPSSPALNLSQHQGLFKWVSSSHQVAKVGVSASASVLPMNIQGWFPLGWTGWISLQPKGLSRLFSSSTVQKHQFFGAQLCL